MGNAVPLHRGDRQRTVHPHVHGERMQLPAVTVRQVGSSPRTWGTRDEGGAGFRHRRFIPTYMGNARLICSGLHPWWVHPHVHGERFSHFRKFSRRSGSSPRTWGTRACKRARSWFVRFIPTYMGNAKYQLIFSVTPGGSSPRTWGTPGVASGAPVHRRFIPTYMGNAY